MTQYCFKCPFCGYKVEQAVREPAPTCNHAEALYFVAAAGIPKDQQQEVAKECAMIRDWKAESIMIDKTAFREHADGTPANPGGIRKKLVSGNVPDPW